MGTLNDAVRAHVKTLDRSERGAFMRNAFDEDDGLTLEAVLGAPYYLSGFTKLDHEHFVRTYHERRNPHLVQRLDLMNRFLDEIERNGPIVHAAFDKAVGAKPSLVKAINAANERALASLNIQPTA
ncbi:hypothetical protein [Tsuneonella rigui]|uniref:hypothetical protein n=1 Tax=Tsuneonella rigui TaxID=1708790 RepID=UPI000F7EE622|nr:hypothetical protein [Tsuneonella rigui]